MVVGPDSARNLALSACTCSTIKPFIFWALYSVNLQTTGNIAVFSHNFSLNEFVQIIYKWLSRTNPAIYAWNCSSHLFVELQLACMRMRLYLVTLSVTIAILCLDFSSPSWLSTESTWVVKKIWLVFASKIPVKRDHFQWYWHKDADVRTNQYTGLTTRQYIVMTRSW